MATGGRFGHVAPGQKVTLRAGDWNGAMDAARWYDQQKNGGATATKNLKRNIIVTVYNASAEDVPRNGILAITGLKITPTDNPTILQDGPILTGDVPSAHDSQFCITSQAIAAGEYGQAVLSGMMPCTVNVIDADHSFAQCDLTSDADGVARLESSNVGAAVVLWKDTGTGEKDALVYFPEGRYRGDVIAVEKVGHGWTAWKAVAADGVADSDWKTADTVNNDDYIRKGVVVSVVDADNVLILVGRGHLPYNAGYTAGERLWLDADAAGTLVDTQDTDDVLWMDLDAHDGQMGTILWPEAAALEEAPALVHADSTTGIGSGMAVGNMVIQDSATGDWDVATVPLLRTAFRKGVIVEKPTTTTATILVAGTYTFDVDPGLGLNRRYGVDPNNDGQAGLWTSAGAYDYATFEPFYEAGATGDATKINMIPDRYPQMGHDHDGDKLYASDTGTVILNLQHFGDTLIHFVVGHTYDDGTYSDLQMGAWGFFYISDYDDTAETATVHFWGMHSEEEGYQGGAPGSEHNHYRTTYNPFHTGQAALPTPQSLTNSYATLTHPSLAGLTIEAKVDENGHKPAISFRLTTDGDYGVGYVQFQVIEHT